GSLSRDAREAVGEPGQGVRVPSGRGRRGNHLRAQSRGEPRVARVRHPATNAEVQPLMEFYQDGRKQGGDFDRGIELTLARILADPKFIYRIETEPATLKGGQSYRLSEVDLASRLSFFLWSSIPDEDLL